MKVTSIRSGGVRVIYHCGLNASESSTARARGKLIKVAETIARKLAIKQAEGVSANVDPGEQVK